MGRRARRGRAAAARGARPRRRRALRLGDGRAGVRAREARARRAPARTRPMLPEEVTGALDAYRLPLSAIADAQVVAVLGDVPLAESAPIVDLWVRKARRNGAAIVTTRPTSVGDADRVVLIWSGPGGRGGATVAQLAEQLGLAGRDGCGAFYVPATPNGRGVADAWAAALRRGARRAGLDRPADRLRRRGRRRPERARARRARRRGDRDLDVPRPRRRLGRPRPAGHELPRARRHLRQPRGPPAAPAPDGDAARAPTSSSGSRSSPSRFGVDARAVRAARLRRGLGALLRRARRSARSASAHRSAATRARRRTSTRRPLPRAARAGRRRACSSSATSRSSRAPRSSACRSSSSSGRGRGRALARPTRARRGIATGDDGRRSRAGGVAVDARARVNQQACATASRASRASTRGGLRGTVDVAPARGDGAMTEPWWISIIKALVIINLVHGHVRVPDAGRAQGDGAHAAPLRPEPRRPVRPAAADRRPRQARAQGGVRAVERDRRSRTSSRRSSRCSPRSRRSR